MKVNCVFFYRWSGCGLLLLVVVLLVVLLLPQINWNSGTINVYIIIVCLTRSVIIARYIVPCAFHTTGSVLCRAWRKWDPGRSSSKQLRCNLPNRALFLTLFFILLRGLFWACFSLAKIVNVSPRRTSYSMFSAKCPQNDAFWRQVVARASTFWSRFEYVGYRHGSRLKQPVFRCIQLRLHNPKKCTRISYHSVQEGRLAEWFVVGPVQRDQSSYASEEGHSTLP